MQRLARDGYTYYPTRDPMDSGGLSGVCSKNATSMPPSLCIRSSQDLFRWTPHCMAVTSSTIFIRHMQIRWVGFMMDQSHSFWAWSERLMTTTTIDTCLVHQTEAQSNHCTVGKSEMCPDLSDLQCSDYHVFNEIMVNVSLWMKMFAQMRTTRILSDTFKYTVAGLSGCRDLLLSKKPCAVAESEVNAGWKLERCENLRDFDHHDKVETWKPGAVVISLFSPIQVVTTVEEQTKEWRGVAFVSNFSWLVLQRHAAAS